MPNDTPESDSVLFLLHVAVETAKKSGWSDGDITHTVKLELEDYNRDRKPDDSQMLVRKGSFWWDKDPRSPEGVKVLEVNDTFVKILRPTKTTHVRLDRFVKRFRPDTD